MSLDGEAVQELRKSFALPEVVDGRPVDATDKPLGRPIVLAPEGWQVIDPKPDAAATLALDTLTGVADYLRHNVDGLTPAELMIHILTHATVDVRAKIEGSEQKFRRQHFVRANAQIPANGIGGYLDIESFTILLITCFVKDAVRDELQAFVSSIRENAVREFNDDGVTQEVKTARGIAFVKNALIKNPWRLAPYRTFRELEQPASDFILRARVSSEGSPKPSVGLFEADGGSWKVAATQAIATWFRQHDDTKGLAIIA